VLELPDTWDDLMTKVLSGNRRNDFRSKWKKLMNNHAGQALQGGTDMPVDTAMDSWLDLHRQRFTDVDSSFITARAITFCIAS